jgi:Flp pilus assembly protein TadG
MMTRGTAVVETAFVMSIVLMVLFGAVQLSLLAFTQTAQDGAAFVAARAYAEHPSAGAAPAQAAAHQIFMHVPIAAIAVSPGSGAVSVTIAQSSGGLPVPGTPASFGLNSIANEPFGSSSDPPFGVTATLSNYYTTPGDNGALAGLLRPRPIVIAQTFGSGNGQNGRFAEWYCRQGVYAALNIPQTTAAAGSFFDPMKAASALHQIYAWDSGATCS